MLSLKQFRFWSDYRDKNNCIHTEKTTTTTNTITFFLSLSTGAFINIASFVSHRCSHWCSANMTPAARIMSRARFVLAVTWLAHDGRTVVGCQADGGAMTVRPTVIRSSSSVASWTGPMVVWLLSSAGCVISAVIWVSSAVGVGPGGVIWSVSSVFSAPGGLISSPPCGCNEDLHKRELLPLVLSS